MPRVDEVTALLRRHSTAILVEVQAVEERLRQGDGEGARLHLQRLEESLHLLTHLVHAALGRKDSP